MASSTRRIRLGLDRDRRHSWWPFLWQKQLGTGQEDENPNYRPLASHLVLLCQSPPFALPVEDAGRGQGKEKRCHGMRFAAFSLAMSPCLESGRL